MMDQPQLQRSSQELQTIFEELLESRNVYYNPPESVKMKYDAIVYTRAGIDNRFANNNVYNQSYRYEVTVITRDPDVSIVDKISKLPMCSFDRSFVSNNLYHNVFTLYY